MILLECGLARKSEGRDLPVGPAYRRKGTAALPSGPAMLTLRNPEPVTHMLRLPIAVPGAQAAAGALEIGLSPRLA